jgi:COP9 signalosome complex subunit 4
MEESEQEDFQAVLDQISPENKLSSYEKLLVSLKNNQIQAFIQKLMTEEMVLQRTIIQSLIDAHKENQKALEMILRNLEEKQIAFESQLTSIYLNLANIYESQSQYSTAASYLSRIPLDSGTRQIQDNYKLEIYIRIVRLYLEDEEFVSADAFLNRAAMLVPNDKQIALQLVACQARSLDFKRQFVQSALKYLELSFEQEMVLGVFTLA